MRGRGGRIAMLVLAGGMAAGMAGGAVSAECRQALAIGLDRSGSVDPAEHALMVEGMAAALEDPGVRSDFLALPGSPVALAIFEWSGERFQRLILDWTVIDSAAALDAVAGRLRTQSPVEAPTGTAVGSAIVYAEALLARSPGCRRLTLDLAGDGRSNAGPAPDAVRFAPAGRQGTVNAWLSGCPRAGGVNPGWPS